MQLQTKANLFLAGSGLLLLILGGLGTYVYLQQTSGDSLATEVKTSAVTPVTTTDNTTPATTTPPHVFIYLATVPLPAPIISGTVSLESTLQTRRSRREFAETPLTLAHLGQMLWAGQGITNEKGGRTAPSSHSAYKLRLFVVVDQVTDLEPGVYEYLPQEHALGQIAVGDRSAAWEAISGQPHPQNAPATIMVAANVSDPEGLQPIFQESGHIGQNFYLQAEAANLAMLVMGGFEPDVAQTFLGINATEKIVYLVPFGNRATEVTEAE